LHPIRSVQVISKTRVAYPRGTQRIGFVRAVPAASGLAEPPRRVGFLRAVLAVSGLAEPPWRIGFVRAVFTSLGRSSKGSPASHRTGELSKRLGDCENPPFIFYYLFTFVIDAPIFSNTTVAEPRAVRRAETRHVFRPHPRYKPDAPAREEARRSSPAPTSPDQRSVKRALPSFSSLGMSVSSRPRASVEYSFPSASTMKTVGMPEIPQDSEKSFVGSPITTRWLSWP
jgi:hypothetical protein